MDHLDTSMYPPSPVLWTSMLLDSLCSPIGCRESWRDVLPSHLTKNGAWFSEENHVVPLNSFFPAVLSYEDFLAQSARPSSLQAMRNFAFATSSTSLSVLTTPLAMLTTLVLVMILRRIKSVILPFFSSVGRSVGRRTHGPEWEKNNEERIVKFGEYVFRLIFHSSISIYGLWYSSSKDWWQFSDPERGTKLLYDGYPFHEVDPGMTWYYLVQAAYNADALISLLDISFIFQIQPLTNLNGSWQLPVKVDWSPTVRGDFQEMFVHHLITNALVIGSSHFRFTRIGSMVFLVHDLSDVPIDMSKLANFLKWKATTAFCFVTMVVVWCVTRLGVLPFAIYRSVLFESWMVVRTGAVPPVDYVCYLPLFIVLLGLLIVLHLIWFGMLIQIGYLLMSKGEAHDLSEHKEGEDQHKDTKYHKKKQP